MTEDAARPELIRVGSISNNLDVDLSVSLELLAQQIILSPHDTIDLLVAGEDVAEETKPLDIVVWKSGLQVYPRANAPDWWIEYRGKRISVDDAPSPLVLKDLNLPLVQRP
jgi:hypothetical protein